VILQGQKVVIQSSWCTSANIAASSVGEKMDLGESCNRFGLDRYSTFIKSLGKLLA